MTRPRRRSAWAPTACLLLLLPLALAAAGPTRPATGESVTARTTADGYRERGWLIWEDLLPRDWNPAKYFEELQIDQMTDDDPRAAEALEKFMKMWNEAPANPETEGWRIKIPGFVVPLEHAGRAKLTEFLLVPFFGACIHVPPPPPNQIIHIRSRRPLAGFTAMDVVWVFGRLKVERRGHGPGDSGYSLEADRVEPYQTEDDG